MYIQNINSITSLCYLLIYIYIHTIYTYIGFNRCESPEKGIRGGARHYTEKAGRLSRPARELRRGL